MKTYNAVLLDSERYELGESPYYDPRSGKYSWVDIVQNRFYTRTENSEIECFDLGQPIGAAIPLKDGEGYLLAARDGLYVLKNRKASLLQDLTPFYKPYLRSNDAKADPEGRVFFGASVLDDRDPEGSLFCYDGQTVRVMQKGTKIANGMAWRSDLKEFYFSDSMEHSIFCYSYDRETGNISERRVLFEVQNGIPDGMCIDSDDNLWVAVWGGSRIEKRSTITGEKLAEISVPALQTTSCCFGGEQMDTLFITSAGVGLSGQYDGCLFTCRVDARGAEPDYVKL
ncbi:MAG: SMP-30/gluconolactonase/LRE family protein [Butyrivibrio sp.]|nr:SMP-30/gluconolactonase/LRE family protein [Butyrivibrio sp.]